MVSLARPKGIVFAYEQAAKALDDQMSWVDALDTKAGVLLAASGVIAGLVLVADSVLIWAPPVVTLVVVFLLIGSLILALASFATRGYETAPDVGDLVLRMHHSDDASLKEQALPSILEALDINDLKIDQKAKFLSYAGISLMFGALLFASYYLYSVLRP